LKNGAKGSDITYNLDMEHLSLDPVCRAARGKGQTDEDIFIHGNFGEGLLFGVSIRDRLPMDPVRGMSGVEAVALTGELQPMGKVHLDIRERDCMGGTEFYSPDLSLAGLVFRQGGYAVKGGTVAFSPGLSKRGEYLTQQRLCWLVAIFREAVSSIFLMETRLPPCSTALIAPNMSFSRKLATTRA